MLIQFEELLSHVEKPIHGILHVGAHLCEELARYQKYASDNIIWIEADPDTCKKAQDRFPNECILNYLVTDEDDVHYQFNVANNNESSSIFDFGTHQNYHKDVEFIGKKILRSKRIDTIYKEHGFREDYANFLNIDIQGAELLALKSMGELIKNFDYVYVEVNTEEVYKNCALLDELKIFLKNHGLEMQNIVMTACKWGDAFFVRK